MKKFSVDFIKRGFVAAAGGPVVMAIVYLVLAANNVVTEIAVTKIATEFLAVTLMAFIAAGITAIYNVDRLSPFSAALIHGAALYVDYILFYLMNGWLKRQALPVLIFTVAFILGYAVIWAIIYFVTKQSVKNLNQSIK